MRLKSEEQHDTLMSEMVRTQKNLENEIRRLQERANGSPTRSPTKSPMSRSPMRVSAHSSQQQIGNTNDTTEPEQEYNL